VECGENRRLRRARRYLRRANTTHVEPVVAIVVVGIQARTIPVQVVAIRRIV